MKKLESPKPIQSLHMHQLKPQLGCILGDGSIRVINVATNNATMWNESPTAAQDKPLLLAFHPSQPFMIALMSKGSMMCWNMVDKDPFLGSVHVISSSNSKELIDRILFHGTLPLILTVNNSGAITTWNFFPRKNTWIVKIMDSLGRCEISPAPIELANRYGHLPNFASKFSTELVVLTEVAVHSSYNYFSFNFRIVGKASTDVMLHQHLLDSVRLGVYCVHLIDHRGCNMVVPQQQTLMFWASPDKETRTRSKSAPSDKFPPKRLNESSGNIGLTPRSPQVEKEAETKELTNVFYFPNETFLLDDLNLLAYAPAYNDISLAKKLPATDYEGILLRPTRVVRSNLLDRFLVFFMRQDPIKELTTFGVAVVCRDTSTKDMTISPAAGQCGIFFGSDEEFIVLSESGAQVEIWKNEEDTTLPMVYDLPSPMSEVFWTPMEGGEIIWFMDLQRSRLIASFKNHISGSKFMLNSQCALQLHPGEEVFQVAWHRQDGTPPLAAVVTSRRVLIVNGKLQIIASAPEVASSCLWLGAAVVFNTKSHLMYLTVRNAVHPLISLRLPDAVLLTLLNDRVALAVRRAGETSLVTNAVGIMEPLIVGFLHYFEAGIEDLDRKERTKILLNCAESYDARRISWQLVEEVTKHGYREFALQLLLANSHLLAGHHQFAFELALTTHHYSTAFTLIERSTLLKTAPNLFRLQRASLKLGQFDVARKCAECTSDWTTLLYLYTLSKNKEGLLIMKKTLERDRDANSGMLSLIDRQLGRPDISSQATKAETAPINSLITPLATNEAQKLLARQDSRVRAKLAAKNFQYTPYPILLNMTHVSNKRWKVENHVQVPCEMRTVQIEGGSGNLLVGPLLLNTLLGDWFTRQVPYFELPEALRGDAAQREAILKLLAERQAEVADRQKMRGTATMSSSNTVPIPTLALHTPATTTTAPTKAPGALTARSHGNSTSSSSAVPSLAMPVGAASGGGPERSPRKITSSATLRPMSTVAANLMNAIANSGPKSSEGSPNQGLGEDSSSPTDSESLGRSAGGVGVGGIPGGNVSAGDTTTTQILALAELALTTDPLVLFARALGKLEVADYDGCILDLNAVLLSLLASNAPNVTIPAADSLLRQQVQICVRYKLVCLLLHQIRKLEDLGVKSAQVAQLSQFLADIPVLPRHRLVLLRMAAKKNVIVQNYGFAAKCLALLLPKGLPDSATLEKQLEECKTKNMRDSERLLEGTRLCVKSFAQKWITERHAFVVCSLCQSSYHANLQSLAAPCTMCFWRGATVLVRAPVVKLASTTVPSGVVSNTGSASTSTPASKSPPISQGIVIGPELSP